MNQNQFSTDHFIGPVHVRVEATQRRMENPEYIRAIRLAIRELQQHLHYVLNPKDAFEALKASDWGARHSVRTKHRQSQQR